MLSRMPVPRPDNTKKQTKEPGFELPEGFTMKWRTEEGLGQDRVEGFALKDPQGRELGFFQRLPGKKTVEEVLKSYIAIRLVSKGRERLKNFIVLEDSKGKEVESWELDQPPKNQIQIILKQLGKS